jgi:hypothetical protein
LNFVGIDLAGVENRPTGFCILDKKLKARTILLSTDKEIIEACKKSKTKIIAIDAPLALPKGRKDIDKRNDVHFRECDKALLKMGIKFFPITLGPMRQLTKRGIALKKKLEKLGWEVIETYPGAAQDILKIPRKQKGIEKLRKGLTKLGVKITADKKISDHELDAVTCAVVAKMYAEKNYIAIGDEKEILMILPK